MRILQFFCNFIKKSLHNSNIYITFAVVIEKGTKPHAKPPYYKVVFARLKFGIKVETFLIDYVIYL